MRFFMIAAASSVAALGLTGCAMTGGGCVTDSCGCESGIVSDECGCGDVGCDECSAYGSMTGIHGGVSDCGYGRGVQNTEMAMRLFAKGPQCDEGCGKFGCGLRGLCLPCRARGGRLRDAASNIGSGGLVARLKEANAIALAEQEAEFAASCGAADCGPGGCALCARGILQHAVGQPYGRAVPHTTPPPAGVGCGEAGMAPTYAYPYYTTRGPRDFLAREPMSIGY